MSLKIPPQVQGNLDAVANIYQMYIVKHSINNVANSNPSLRVAGIINNAVIPSSLTSTATANSFSTTRNKGLRSIDATNPSKYCNLFSAVYRNNKTKRAATSSGTQERILAFMR